MFEEVDAKPAHRTIICNDYEGFRRFYAHHELGLAARLGSTQDTKELDGKKHLVEKDATILFADIRNFSKVTEDVTPTKIVDLITDYVSIMISAVSKYRGILDKSMGDGIMAFWGDFNEGKESEKEDAPVNAILCGLKIQEMVRKFNEKYKKSLQVGIGINSGKVAACVIGTRRRADYTIIGGSVNLAERIEKESKGSQVYIGEDTYCKVKERKDIYIKFSTFGLVGVRGRKEKIQIYEVLELRGRKEKE